MCIRAGETRTEESDADPHRVCQRAHRDPPRVGHRVRQRHRQGGRGRADRPVPHPQRRPCLHRGHHRARPQTSDRGASGQPPTPHEVPHVHQPKLRQSQKLACQNDEEMRSSHSEI